MSDHNLPQPNEQDTGLILELEHTEKRPAATWMTISRWIYLIIAAVAAISILAALFLRH